MKKFFTLALAAATTLGAAAALPQVKAIDGVKGNITLHPATEFKGNYTLPTLNNRVMSRADEGTVLTAGEYKHIICADYQDQGVYELSYNQPTIIAEENGEYTLQLPNVFGENTSVPVPMTYDSENDAFIIAGDAVVAKNVELTNGSTVDVKYRCSAVQDNQFLGFLKKDADVIFLPEAGAGLHQAQYNINNDETIETGIAFICTIDGEDYWMDWNFRNYIFMPNSQWTTGAYNDNGELTQADGDCFAFTYNNPNYGTMAQVWGFAGFGGPMLMLYDEEAGTVNGKTYFCSVAAGETLFFANLDDPNSDYEGTCKVENGALTVNIPSFGVVNENAAIRAEFEDATIKINGSSEGGINTVATDVDNANAPVEYFTLQGIRVNEPAAGSLVIRRQGTEVSKILVK